MDRHHSSVALVLRIPLFSGGSWQASHRQEREKLALNKIHKEKEFIQLQNKLKQQSQKIQVLKENLMVQKMNVATHEELHRLVSLNYRLGNASIFDLLSSQDDLMEAKIKLVELKVDLSLLMRQYGWEIGVGTSG